MNHARSGGPDQLGFRSPLAHVSGWSVMFVGAALLSVASLKFTAAATDCGTPPGFEEAAVDVPQMEITDRVALHRAIENDFREQWEQLRHRFEDARFKL